MKTKNEIYNNRILRELRRVNEAITNNNDLEKLCELQKKKNCLQMRMLKKNIKLIFKVTNLVGYKSVMYEEDYFSEFCIIFLECLDTYDGEKQANFGTYFYNMCKWSFERLVCKIEGNLTRKYQHYSHLIKKFIEKYQEQNNGKAPSEDEIRIVLGVGEKTFNEIMQVLSFCKVSTDTPANKYNDSNSTIGDFLIAREMWDVDNKLILEELILKLAKFLLTLEYLDKEIFKYWTGICTYKSMQEFLNKLKISKKEYAKRRKHIWYKTRQYFRYDEETLHYLLSNASKKKHWSI